MNHASAFFIPPSANGSDPGWLESALDDLRHSYESVGRQLDLFTSRETDSETLFALSEEIEIGLIALFSALECDLGTSGPTQPGNLREGAERLQDSARWLEGLIDRLHRDYDHPRLADSLESLAVQCQDIASGLWWQWLGDLEPDLDVSRPALSTGSRTPAGSLIDS